MKIVEMRQVSCRKGSRSILSEIDWEIEVGERWIVMGSNGCGKTTLASVLAGYRAWSDGYIGLFGQSLNQENAVTLRKQIGFVSSSYFDKCIQRENGLNIVLGAVSGQLADGLDITDQNVRRAKRILRALGLGHKGMYPYDLLSKGQQQKILLARAFMRPLQLLVLDEPMSGLDMLSRDYALNTLSDIAERTDCTMIYVTHHADEILPFFTHALLLKNGRIHSKGIIREIITADNMSDFLEQPIQVMYYDEKIYFKAEKSLRMNEQLWQQEEG